MSGQSESSERRVRLAKDAARWWIAVLLMGVTLVNYLDRTCLAVAAPVFMRQLALSALDYSKIVAAFQIAYLVTQPLAGRFIDWLGVRIGLAVSIAWWSGAQMLAGLSGGWRSFAAFRGLLGVGEAANFPSIAKVVAEWFSPRERTMATAVANLGAGLGQAVAAPFVAYLVSQFDWRVSFVVTGAIGLGWVGLWSLVYPVRAPAPAPALKERSPWSAVLTDRNFWALAVARFLSEPAWQFFTYWIPLYLASERHMKLKDIGAFAWLPFLAADAGSLFGGALSPLFMRLGFPLLSARKLSTTVCALLMVPAIFIGTAKSAAWAIAFFCVAAFAHQAMSATLLTLPADLFPTRAVGTANGLSGTIGGIGGMGFTLIVGFVVMQLGYAPLFVAIALFDLVGSAALWVFLRSKATGELVAREERASRS